MTEERAPGAHRDDADPLRRRLLRERLAQGYDPVVLPNNVLNSPRLRSESRIHRYWKKRRALSAVADKLGISVREEISSRPWVITGNVDGRAFYALQSYAGDKIVVASDDRANVCPWDAPDMDPVIVLHSVTSIFPRRTTEADYEPTLRFIVAKIREYLLVARCEHTRLADARYCPRCGVPLADEV